MIESIAHRPSPSTTEYNSLFIKWLCLHEACHDGMAAHLHDGSGPSAQPLPTPFSRSNLDFRP